MTACFAASPPEINARSKRSSLQAEKGTPGHIDRALPEISLTMTYFHTGVRTIIGAESFHGPVRDGKGWDRLAMVIRLDWVAC